MTQPKTNSLASQPRGRPSRAVIYDRLASEVADMTKRFGGLPSATEAEPIWRGIWFEEAHNSTALEGNTLVLREVEELLRKKKAVGNKELRDYLEVRGYAEAAQWVYGQGIDAGGWSGGPLVSLAEVREVHRLTVAPVWEFAPPANALPDEGPGNWRRHEIAPMASGIAPPPFTQIPSLMTDWVNKAASLTADTALLPERVSELHAELERIHPFLDGNGRAGRLLMNLVLVRLGYPPAVIYARERTKYLDALKRADHGDPAPLGELVARAVLNNLVRLVYPAIAGDVKLIPLEALATKDLSVRALRQAASRGRLRAVQSHDRVWRSTKRWVSDYRASRYQTLKEKRTVGRVASMQGVARVSATGVVTNPENKSISQP